MSALGSHLKRSLEHQVEVSNANREFPENGHFTVLKMVFADDRTTADYRFVVGRNLIFQREINMSLRNKFGRILCGAGLAIALILVPASWAFVSPQPSRQAGSRASSHSAIARVDINTATADQLKSLPGIGDVYAKRIIAGRPYHSKNQLVSRGILSRSVYDNIKQNLIAHHIKK